MPADRNRPLPRSREAGFSLAPNDQPSARARGATVPRVHSRATVAELTGSRRALSRGGFFSHARHGQQAYPIDLAILTPATPDAADGTTPTQRSSGIRRVEQVGACVGIVVALAAGLGLLDWLPALIAQAVRP